MAKTKIRPVIPPEFTQYWENACQAITAKQPEEAAKWFEKSAEACPEVWIGLAGKDFHAGNYTQARNKLMLCLKYAKQRKTIAAAMNSIGTTYESTDDLETARRYFEKAAELLPAMPDSWGNLAMLEQWTGDINKAIELFDRSLRCDPTCHHSRFGKAMAVLLKGDYEQGWPLYESRWMKDNLNKLVLPSPKPEWAGQSLDGKRIFIYGEQGAGDTIQMLRYLPKLRDMGASVSVVTQKGITSLIKDWDWCAKSEDGGTVSLDFDYILPAFSLPRVFKTRLNNIPPCPYITKPEPMQLDGDFKVGICWAGSGTHKQDKRRSIPLSVWSPILGIAGVTWYSLQVGPREVEADMAPCAINRLSLKSYGDTARAIAGLDLVISVDTSVVHVAGAIGAPCWLLNSRAPDFRWLQSGESSPWYPSVRIFRQEALNEWQPVINRVAVELSKSRDCRVVDQTAHQSCPNRHAIHQAAPSPALHA